MRTLVALIGSLLLIPDVVAHPASAIVVHPGGQIFFVYTGHGVMRVAADGTISNIHPSKGGHWMALDPEGIFSRSSPKYFERITADGIKPAIIFADGGAPIAVNSDGNLYYGSFASRDDPVAPGGLTVTRMSPDGKLTDFAPSLGRTLADFKQGVTGLASGPDGTLYVAASSAILKVKPDGAVAVVAHPITAADCDWDPPDHDQSNHLPCLRGLAVAADGTIYAAATSCRRVLKITPDAKVSVMLKSEAPWSPTAVALQRGGVLYVLEYTNANGGPGESGGWLPRVRKVDAAGKLTTLVDLSRDKADAGKDRGATTAPPAPAQSGTAAHQARLAPAS
jgi:hypothetical protein